MQAKDRIIVALDVDLLDKAVALVKQLRDYVGGFKVGLELLNSAGAPQVIEAISQAGGPVFFDGKFKDIPNTVAGAVRAITRPGVNLVVGRPITNPEIGDPVSAAKRVAAEIETALYNSLTDEQILQIFGEMGAIYDNDHFVYTKGGHGKAYVNKDDIYVDPDKLSLFCQDIAWRCRTLEAQAVAGPTVGGVLVAQWVTYWLRRFTGDDKIVAIFADEAGEGKRVLKRNFPSRVAGKKVLVVEDVINTGASAAATIRAVEEAGGEVVACFALCNRSANKLAVSELIGKPDSALLKINMDNYPPTECPYCKEERSINQRLGHGKKFLEELAIKDSEKAKRLGWTG